MLLSPLAQATERVCTINPSYIIRNSEGQSLSLRLYGFQECVGEPETRSYRKNGQTRRATFQAVRTEDGQIVYVANVAVTNVPHPPRFRPDPEEVFQVEDAQTEETGSTVTETETRPPLENIEIREGFNIRSTPSGQGRHNIIGSTSTMAEDIEVVYENGNRIVQNGYVKIQVDGRQYWLHESAIQASSVSEPEGAAQELEIVEPEGATRGLEIVQPEETVEEPAVVETPADPNMALSSGEENVFDRVPDENWAATRTALNLRNEPGTSGTQALALLDEGGRVAVLESRQTEGQTWHRVIPFDCDSVHEVPGSDPNMADGDRCHQSYWVSGAYLQRTDRPTSEEVASRPVYESYTEGGICENCNDPFEGVTEIQSLGDQIEAASVEGSGDLLEAFAAAQASFLRRFPRGRRSPQTWARTYRAAFIQHLIDEMGVERAAQAVVALTAYGEARGEQASSEWGNIGEMALVVAVIDNRAETNFRARSSLVRSNHPAARRMKVALARSQFSAWNLNDPNLPQMMLASPNTETLQRAFRAVELMDGGQIQPLGDLAQSNTRHYFTGRVPRWAYSGREIRPRLQTPGGTIRISSHRVFRGVP